MPVATDQFTAAWESFFRTTRRLRSRAGRLPIDGLSLPQYHLLEALRGVGRADGRRAGRVGRRRAPDGHADARLPGPRRLRHAPALGDRSPRRARLADAGGQRRDRSRARARRGVPPPRVRGARAGGARAGRRAARPPEPGARGAGRHESRRLPALAPRDARRDVGRAARHAAGRAQPDDRRHRAAADRRRPRRRRPLLVGVQRLHARRDGDDADLRPPVGRLRPPPLLRRRHPDLHGRRRRRRHRRLDDAARDRACDPGSRRGRADPARRRHDRRPDPAVGPRQAGRA